MTINPVIWFEIHVQDMSRARAFYEEVFQIKLERLKSHIDMWGFPMAMERTGAGGALVYMDGVESGGTGTTVYFACADCATEAGRAASSGPPSASMDSSRKSWIRKETSLACIPCSESAAFAHCADVNTTAPTTAVRAFSS